MKRYLIFILLLACAIGSAQNINDVLRYGTENLQGTARFQGMGGAFGALGGDLSALNINPAGSAVFNNSLITLSGTAYSRDNDASYFGAATSTSINDSELNQVGGVFVFRNTDEDSDWKKFSLAFNYDAVNNFNNRTTIRGNSNQSVANYFLDFAQGLPLEALQVPEGELIENAYRDLGFEDQQAFLGFQGFVFDLEDIDAPDSGNYLSNAKFSDNGSFNQDYFIRESGYNNKFTLNAGSQYTDRFYLGASLNFHSVLYDRLTRLTENGFDADSNVQFIEFDNFLRTQGAGFSFSVGGIAKLNEYVRLGGSYQSPTWYRLEDEFSQFINSNLAQDAIANGESDIDFINLDLITAFQPYTIKTPSKLNGSLAIIFGKNGLLSFDYGYQDFSKSELRPTNDGAFQPINAQISDDLGAVSTFRLGGEYRIQKFSLRGGYRFEQSPYTNGNTIDDLTGYSGGIGYNFGGSRLDLAINRTEQRINESLFNPGSSTTALVDRINTNATLSYTINF
ncbi:OmpP1/FadL family transporter [Maribacter sp. 2210JD10-5]|uniref:OmpP1/FadL family transporter n=1 Tax=Maribacter sp. 2210JD10-5 TaxID=3386272 RepID=UPI0039BC3406